MLILWIGVLILVLLKQFADFDLPLNWFFILVPLFVFYIGFHGIKQQIIYPENSPFRSIPVKIKTIDKNSYKKSGLQQADMKEVYYKLTQSMQQNKLFLRPTLSLPELSSELKIPQHHITQTLNDYARKNFYDFVNSYRIQTVINRLENGDAKNFSLLGIAFDCGFNSKSSFNRIFKNITGLTPTKFITKHNNRNISVPHN